MSYFVDEFDDCFSMDVVGSGFSVKDENLFWNVEVWVVFDVEVEVKYVEGVE